MLIFYNEKFLLNKEIMVKMGPHIDFSPKPKSYVVICMGPTVLSVQFALPQSSPPNNRN